MHPEKELSELEQHLGYTFRSKDTLRQALVHRSYINEHPDFSLDHNERLEFLGDAVLELVITDHLYHHYSLPEGEMTNLRSAVVRGEMLSQIAQDLHIDDFMLLSRGERKDTGKARQYILANAVEAIIGAIYEDGGYDAAKDMIDRYITVKLKEIEEKELHIDSKSKFQELAQEIHRVTPTYKVEKEEGLDHAKKFTIGAYLQDRKVGEGIGSSKQEAQQAAAQQALQTLSASK